ncbi:MAG: undecaprenyl-diphosphatase [Candidatus Magasanikbacteria bacterium RIFOXYD2_FULL_39_9]|uniref:Undecaprenyl-diphosphatase n=1 Tax=Candidatus Magasanikbacteria bacterium RIFOXYD1_FULL_40_23 TaxID=1798705 RepID=A0A1F6P931_9BACT|nr:MAG: undecaprenyl-diphosphatase [Candidatus Magasanikbacteria bacterium RIFOXYD1_FULL_40_23]OGH93080.1 MAG: undecaprenyl-diphosphatase [Candidatus Magasanikbacteria bacterium RIFOXYD2_FULL_39_9]
MFLDIIKAITLGLVEGITEFLPISSTGHLIIVNKWLSFAPSFTVMFDVVIQLGAILAVIVVFWKKLWPFGKDEASKSTTLNVLSLHIWYKTILAVLPALVLGALFGSFIEEKLFNPLVVAVALILGGVVLIVIEKRRVATPVKFTSEISYRTAFLIGLFQCLAMVPGTSRAAATIIGAMLLGASRVVAVEFSFFLAIPTMLAATAYSLLKYNASIGISEVIILGVGFMAAFFTALAVIKFLLNYIQNNNFKAFGYYRIGLGVLILLFFTIL